MSYKSFSCDNIQNRIELRDISTLPNQDKTLIATLKKIWGKCTQILQNMYGKRGDRDDGSGNATPPKGWSRTT